MRDLFIWAFVPGEDVRQQWEILANDISGKMPFGYFYLIKSKIGDLTYSSGTASPVVATIFGNDMTILDFSTISDFAGSFSWTLLQNLFQVVLWFSLIFYIFNRLNDLKL